ncbi:MAG: O-antigen ligase C-terminal domain-containing protein [Dechloromonas sp.]|nr:O-antigen ligase C-terminal domain-containing protein [Dechloromonas sp.]
MIFHLAAEMGIPFALAVAGLLGWWGIRVWRARLALPGLWALASLGVIGVHSMLEFPLWFAHFLGLAMVFAAVVDREVVDRRGATRTWEMPFRLLGAFGVATVVLLGLQHQRVESAFSTIRFQRLIGMAGPSGFPELDTEILESLDELPKWSPWQGYGSLAILYGGNPAPEHAAQWAPLCGRVLYFDVPPVVFARCAIIHKLIGNEDEAQRFAQWGCAGYPRPQDGFGVILRHVAQTMAVADVPRVSCLSD